MTRLALALVGALVTLAHAPVAAGAEMSPAQVQQRIIEAQRAFRAGRYGAALRIFREVADGHPPSARDPRLQWNIARCFEELGRYEEAVAAFETAAQSSRGAERRARAEARAAALRARHFGRARVECPSGAKLRIEGLAGERTCPIDWPDARAGSHPGMMVDSQGRSTPFEVRVLPGEETRIALEPVEPGGDRRPDGSSTDAGAGAADPGAAPADPAASLVSPAPVSAPRSDFAAAATTAGAAALAVGGGVLLYLATRADGQRQAAEDELLSDPSPSAARRFDDNADLTNFYGIGGWSALGLGTALGAVATWMWLDPDAFDRAGRAAPGEPARGGDAPGWLLTGGSAALLAGGGALLYLAHGQDTQRASAGRAWATATDPADQARLARSFEASADRADVLGVYGWSTLGLGAALGAAAAWWWWGPIDSEVRVAPGGVGVSGRF